MVTLYNKSKVAGIAEIYQPTSRIRKGGLAKHTVTPLTVNFSTSL